MAFSGALDKEVGEVVATLPDGTEYRQVLHNPADGEKHVTPDGRIWFAAHEGVVDDVVITTPLTIHWKGHTVCGNNIFDEVEEYKRINSAQAARKIRSAVEALSIPLANYIPKAPDAIKNICFNFHVFQNSSGKGNFLSSEASRLIQIWRWTNQLYITVNPSTDYPNPMPAQLISDTWIRFELNRIEFYQDNALNVSTSVPDLQAAAVARNPSSLNQVNVYITAGTHGGASGFAQLPDAVNMGLDSWVVLLKSPDSNGLISPGGDFAGSGTLAHEFGHVLDLAHTYQGGGVSANCNTADPDFLIDVFGNPSDCFHLCSWPQGKLSPQGTRAPNTAVTNNLMGGNQNNTWTSALQAAMMHRALTEKSVKRYVVTPQFQSAQFPNVYLRMDGGSVTQFTGAGGGTVNCQFGSFPWEKFRLEPQPDGSVAIGSVQFPNVYLRMDGSSVTQFNGAGSGTVNCQFGVGPWEKFRLEYQPDGTFAIASVQFPNVYLRMDGSGVTQFAGAGAGTVNCQFGVVGPWEKFRFCPGS